MRKIIALGIMLLFLGMTISSSTGLYLEKQSTVDVIIVDDEGDGDYTSIKEAVNNSNPGDTIEVYSGTYNEYRIRITKEHIKLIGVAQEYGGGNDTGKPFINGSGKGNVIRINVSNVTVSNFRIENPWSGGTFVYPIKVGDVVYTYQENIIISNNTISNSSISGIQCSNNGKNIKIIDNRVSNCNKSGICLNEFEDSIITNNTIIDCEEYAISIWARYNIIKGNIIKRCENGIYLSGISNKIQGNQIEKVGSGVFVDAYTRIKGNSITHNNFINTTGKQWFETLIFTFNKWDNNYWDDWNGIGPKRIPGIKILFVIPIPFLGGILIKAPWFKFDWHPAEEPYDIGV